MRLRILMESRIVRLACPPCMYAYRCLDHGVRYPHLYIKFYGPDYRGMHAMTSVGDDTIIMEVPLKLVMTSEVAKESEICKRLIASGCRLRSTHSYLASYLLEERRHIDKSFWAPYIHILPSDFNAIPIFFSADELRYLKGSFVLEKIADRTVTGYAESPTCGTCGLPT